MDALFQSLQHPSPSMAAMGFAVTLVAWLVAAEEAERRRTPAVASDDPRG